jgi:hypothetical protein
MLRYHQAAVDLLSYPPTSSKENAALFAECEKRLGRSLPEAVREWYGLDRSVEILREYSNCDEPVQIEELGLPVGDWYGSGRRDFLQDDLLWIMAENQGVCNWAVKLDGSNDPPVLVEVDSAPNDNWQVYSSTFSEFIYCQIWDHPTTGFGCSAQETKLAEADLQFLNQQFERGPSTATWPGCENFRFSSAEGKILIWFAENHGADWFLFAQNEKELVELIRSVWRCGNLVSTLYGNDAIAERVLSHIRSE